MLTFKRCKLVVGGSAIALKILAADSGSDASLCSTCSLSIHGFFSVTFPQYHFNKHHSLPMKIGINSMLR